MAQFLVTGGSGFIGSHLCRKLLGEGHGVRVLDNLSSGKRANLSDVAGDIDFHEADLRDEDAVQRAVKGVEYILHHAAVASVQTSVEEPLKEQQINSVGTLNLLEAARQAGVRRVVFAASAAAYGNDPRVPKREDMRPTPESPYAISKLAGEYYCGVYDRLYGLETVCLRYFNVYGPRQDPASPYSGVISIFAKRMLNGLGTARARGRSANARLCLRIRRSCSQYVSPSGRICPGPGIQYRQRSPLQSNGSANGAQRRAQQRYTGRICRSARR